MAAPATGPSKKALDRAGTCLRDWWLSARELDQAELQAARLVWAYQPRPTPRGPVVLAQSDPQERLNREIGRRTDVAGIVPDDRSLIRLATGLVIEQNDEWLVGRRCLSLDSLAPLLEERREQNGDEEVLELTATLSSRRC